MESLTELPRLSAELWLSFVSMLRSYAAAASLHAGEVKVAANENEVTLAAGDVKLAMRFDPETSAVSWTKREAAGEATQGRFELTSDGTVEIHGVQRDLDHAAIDWIASVTPKGGRG
jgi:hypothetical protein